MRKAERCFHHPVTKRKLCYLPSIEAALPWRTKKFIYRHCTHAHATHIITTRPTKAKCLDDFFYHFFYAPELSLI